MTQTPPPNEDELGIVLALSAAQLYDCADPAVFLDWIASAGPTLAPGIAAQIDPATTRNQPCHCSSS